MRGRGRETGSGREYQYKKVQMLESVAPGFICGNRKLKVPEEQHTRGRVLTSVLLV